ncbi:MAG: hypothetical protein KC478_16195, partial [Bacteriovoracaceae bacterium]|nr:hypothetical protein [Bacteriovoracaceae bacterium]
MEGTRNFNDYVKSIWVFPVLSGIFHVVFLCSQIDALKFDVAQSEPKENRILIKLTSKDSKKQQVVQTIKSLENLAPKEDSFLGKTNNTFSRQTKAKETGSFKPAGLGHKSGVKQTVKNSQE